MPSSAEIVAAANAQIAALQETERETNQQIAAIKDNEWDRPLTDAERASIDDLRATLASTLSAIEEVSYVTMAALDKTDEVKRIRNAIAGVIADLTAKKARIDKFGQIATKIGNAIGGLQDLAGKLPAA
jgi:chromosome segregation ATPase